MEKNLELAKTLIGLRNIAWAANRNDHLNITAHYIHSTIELLLATPDNVETVKKIIVVSSNNV